MFIEKTYGMNVKNQNKGNSQRITRPKTTTFADITSPETFPNDPSEKIDDASREF